MAPSLCGRLPGTLPDQTHFSYVFLLYGPPPGKSSLKAVHLAVLINWRFCQMYCTPLSTVTSATSQHRPWLIR